MNKYIINESNAASPTIPTAAATVCYKSARAPPPTFVQPKPPPLAASLSVYYKVLKQFIVESMMMQKIMTTIKWIIHIITKSFNVLDLWFSDLMF